MKIPGNRTESAEIATLVDKAATARDLCDFILFKYEIISRVRALEDAIDSYEAGLTVGCRMVQKKRGKHLTKHGYTDKHDDKHAHGELAQAGVMLGRHVVTCGSDLSGLQWPFSERFEPSSSDIENLVNAASFYIAEIDRRWRAMAPQQEEGLR